MPYTNFSIYIMVLYYFIQTLRRTFLTPSFFFHVLWLCLGSEFVAYKKGQTFGDHYKGYTPPLLTLLFCFWLMLAFVFAFCLPVVNNDSPVPILILVVSQ